MTRAAHQDIDALAAMLGKRAEIEGLAKGIRISARRQVGRWALVWSVLLSVAIAVGMSVSWLWWLPLATAALALASLAAILVLRARVRRKISLARARLERLGEELAQNADSDGSDKT